MSEISRGIISKVTSGVYERTQWHRDLISEGLKQWHKTHPMKGRKFGSAWNHGIPHSKETKERISISMKLYWQKKKERGDRFDQ